MHSFGRAAILALVTCFAFSSSEHLAAQQLERVPGLSIPVTGLGDAGSLFTGTFRILRFETRDAGVVAIGTINGVVNDSAGTIRNVVTQIAMPLDINATSASRNTDIAIAQSSCEALFLQLGTSAFSVLGANVAINPASFYVATAAQATPVTTSQSTRTGTASAVVTGQGNTSAVQGATSSSSFTTSPTVVTPGTIAGQTRSTTARSSSTQLGSLLCSLSTTTAATNTTQFAQVLNQILGLL
jgi:hypothetical protein